MSDYSPAGSTGRKRGRRSNNPSAEPAAQDIQLQSDNMEATVLQTFGDTPHSWQEEAVRTVMDGHDLIISAGTGAGESLSFQVPSVLQQDTKVVVVVSPLDALMQNHVRELQTKFNISCIADNSQSSGLPADRMMDIEAGKYRIVYVSPERILTSPAWLSLSQGKSFYKKVSFIAIDESLYIEQWGESGFRKQWGELGILRALYPRKPLMALSASLSPDVLKYVKKSLRMDHDVKILRLPMNQPNVVPMVRPITGATKDRRDLAFMVNDMEGQMAVDVQSIPQAIVYGDTINDCTISADYLLKSIAQNFPGQTMQTPSGRPIVAVFHRYLPLEDKIELQEEFERGQIRILCPKEAFGVDVNIKPVDRVVIIGVVNSPKQKLSLETIIQRFGRAGRDPNKPALAVLFAEPWCFEPGNGVNMPPVPKPHSPRNPSALSTSEMLSENDSEQGGSNTASDSATSDGEDSERDIVLRATKKMLGDVQKRRQMSKGTHMYINTTGCRRLIVKKYFNSMPDQLPNKCFRCDNCITCKPVLGGGGSHGYQIKMWLGEPHPEVVDTRKRGGVCAKSQELMMIELERMRWEVCDATFSEHDCLASPAMIYSKENMKVVIKEFGNIETPLDLNVRLMWPSKWASVYSPRLLQRLRDAFAEGNSTKSAVGA